MSYTIYRWPLTVSFPIENGDFPVRDVNLPDPLGFGLENLLLFIRMLGHHYRWKVSNLISCLGFGMVSEFPEFAQIE